MIAHQQADVKPLHFNTLLAAVAHCFRDPKQTLKSFQEEWKQLTEKDKVDLHEMLIKDGYTIGQAPGSSTSNNLVMANLPVVHNPNPVVNNLSLPPVEVKDDDGALHASQGYTVGDEHPTTKAA